MPRVYRCGLAAFFVSAAILTVPASASADLSVSDIRPYIEKAIKQ
jgi:hypothetical protein